MRLPSWLSNFPPCSSASPERTPERTAVGAAAGAWVNRIRPGGQMRCTGTRAGLAVQTELQAVVRGAGCPWRAPALWQERCWAPGKVAGEV